MKSSALIFILSAFLSTGWTFSRETIGGLPTDTNYLEVRKLLDQRIRNDGSVVISTFTNTEANLTISLQCDAASLQVFEESGAYNLNCNLSHSSPFSFTLSFTSDYPVSVKFSTTYALNLSASTNFVNRSLSLPLSIDQIGDSYIIARAVGGQIDDVAVGVRMLVLRKGGIADLLFRIGLILLLILATFFMGCEVEIDIIKSHLRRPIGPLLGFLCQFLVMPGVSPSIFLAGFLVKI